MEHTYSSPGKPGTIPVLFLLAALLVSGCRKEDDIVPDDSTDPGKPLVSGTIGVNGGSMESDSLVLIIPAGAFRADCKLEVYVSEAAQSFRGIAVTRQYTIQGLPGDFTDSILIKLKYRGLLTDESFLCHGAQYKDEQLDSTVTTYDLNHCTDSSGYLVGYYKRPLAQAHLEGSSIKKAGFQPEPDVGEILDFFLGLTSYRTYEMPAFKVKLNYPTTLDPGVIQKFSGYLEEIYRLFLNTGFNDSIQDFVFPAAIQFIDNRDGGGPGVFYAMGGSWYVSYDTGDDEVLSSLRESTICGILDQFRYSVSLRPHLYFLYSGGAYWFDYAVDKWYLRQHFQKTEVQKDDIELVFKGLHGSDHERAHMGGAEVVEHLVNMHGNLLISRVYRKIIEGNCAMDAISAVVGQPVNQWLPNFYKDFLEGRIHQISGDTFNNLVFKDELITSRLDFPDPNNPVTLKADYRELSARVFYFDTDDSRIDESSSLLLKFTGGDVSVEHYKLLLFACHRETHEIVFMNEGRELTVHILKTYKEEGYDLLALVVNCYYSAVYTEQAINRTNIWLFVDMQHIETLNIPVCTIMLGGVDVQYKNDDDATWTAKNQSFSFTNAYRQGAEIYHVNDSSYAARWDYYKDESHYWGEITILINPETLLMYSIDFIQNERFIDLDKGSDWKIESRLQCESVLLDSYMRFRADQVDISDHLVSLQYRKESYSKDKTIVSEVDELTLTDNSWLDIHF